METGAKIGIGTFVLIVIIVAILVVSPLACTRVPPGQVGVRVKLYGAERGVDDVTQVTGMVWYNPWREEVHRFPTFMQTATWTSDATEGSPVDESITFASKEGASFNADVFVSGQFIAEKVPDIFRELRQDADQIMQVYVRSKVRGAFDRVAELYSAPEILGGKKAELLNKVREMAQDDMNGWFMFDSVEFIGRPRVPDDVEKAINASIAATQKAIEAENKVKQIEAEAQQAIAQAEGIAQSRLKQANAESEAMLIKAKAESESNNLINASITPVLMQYRGIDRWDGKLPTVLGSETVPMIQMPTK